MIHNGALTSTLIGEGGGDEAWIAEKGDSQVED